MGDLNRQVACDCCFARVHLNNGCSGDVDLI